MAPTVEEQQTIAEEGFNQDNSNALIDCIGEALLEKKAVDVTVLDVRELTTLTDAFVVCHAESDVQVKALANNVAQRTREQLDEKPWQTEGLQQQRWVILDYVNVVVHIFKQELREYYGLERMWSDATIKKIEDDL